MAVCALRYRQVVTDRSVLELHYPHLTAPDAPDRCTPPVPVAASRAC
jgi:hypothetical protein